MAADFTYLTAFGSPYSLGNSDCIIKASASSGNVNMCLPDAGGIAGRIYIFKRVDDSSNYVSLWSAGGDKIDGASYYRLYNKWDHMTIVSDGINWLIIGKSW